MKQVAVMSWPHRTSARRSLVRASILVIWVAGIAVGNVRPASAEEPSHEPPKAPDATSQADRLYRKGVEAYKARRYDEALAAFKAAYDTKPAVAVLRNLGAAEVRAGKFVDGARHLSQWLRATTGASAEDTQASQDLLRNAENQLAQLNITNAPDGADISVDDELIGSSPLGFRVHVDAGKHVVRARKGELLAEQTVTTSAGSVLEVKLDPKSPARTPDIPTSPTNAVKVSLGPSPRHVAEQPGPGAWDAILIAGGGIGVVGSALAIGALLDERNQGSGSSSARRDQTLEEVGVGVMAVGTLGFVASIVAISIFNAPSSFSGVAQITVEPHRAGVSLGGNF